MTRSRQDVLALMDGWLQPGDFSDYCPNGLQVEGTDSISHIVTGVTASQALLEAAAELNADMVLVHHGYFWKNEAYPLVGMKYQRIKTLIEHNMNLVAYHLPLDYQQDFGNNASLAKLLEITVTGQFGGGSKPLGMLGTLMAPQTGNGFASHIAKKLGREPLHVEIDKPISKVAWCTGGAQGYIDDAIAAGADAFISGEVSESTFHIAKEAGIHYFAAGHHATERYGVQALGAKVAAELALRHTFVDIPNPV